MELRSQLAEVMEELKQARPMLENYDAMKEELENARATFERFEITKSEWTRAGEELEQDQVGFKNHELIRKMGMTCDDNESDALETMMVSVETECTDLDPGDKRNESFA